MRACIPLLLVVLCTSALAAPPVAPAPGPRGDVEAQLKARDPKKVVVIPQGQYYHRYDHLVVSDVLSISPEEAQRRGYAGCPECVPPSSSGALETPGALATSGARGTAGSPGVALPPYYRAYLANRANAAFGGGGRGGGAGAGAGAGGGLNFGQGLIPGVSQGFGSAASVGGAYNSVFVR